MSHDAGGKSALSEMLGPLPRHGFSNFLAGALFTADQMRSFAAATVAAAHRDWSGKMEHADARVRALTEALREVLDFQSAPKGPTIHDWGRWRRVADDSDLT